MQPDYTVILQVLTGSHMYGTSVPESDIDIKGVVIPKWKTLVNPFANFEQHIETKEIDLCLYSIRKFFQLAIDCNPTVIELLFATPTGSTYDIWTPEWNRIFDYRWCFVSNKARNTFNGYALSQLKRIKLHRAWLLNPPSHKPLREEYGLPASPHFGLEKVEVLIHAPSECIKEEWREYALKEKSYHDAHEYYKQYENWLATRNPKRAALEAKSGYDTKHGMHLYRLLTEGVELLTTGKITLPRPDRELLLEIRGGKYSYDELMLMVGDFTTKIDTIESVLPDKPDMKGLTNLYYYLLPEKEL